jgi:mono/diheme cytochrome c family protein
MPVVDRRRSLPTVAAAVALLGAILAGCGSGDSGRPSASGATLYASNCARCHGVEGGGGGVGPSLVDVAATFPDIDNQITFVSNGGGGMPRFGDLLSDADIREVVTYTRAAFR